MGRATIGTSIEIGARITIGVGVTAETSTTAVANIAFDEGRAGPPRSVADSARSERRG